MAKKILQVKNLQVAFRTQGGILKAVRNVSFDLDKGETLAIVGESGSGKSVTSKAIIGILAGNSIVEGGEILYDGNDLLKIDEEHFHKIRGNKISMIFQDPLSSLNPIMRVGKQLTEAMILNGKAKQRDARNEFNTMLKLMNQAMNEAMPESIEENDEACKIFNSFCMEATHLEKAYDDAQAAAVELQEEVGDTSFLLSKKQKVDIVMSLRKFLKLFPKTLHPYVVIDDEKYQSQFNRIRELSKLPKKRINPEEVIRVLNNVDLSLQEAIAKPAPNWFRLGYYLYRNPDFDYTKEKVTDLDEMTLKYLDDNFMNRFFELGINAIVYSHNKSIKGKKEHTLAEVEKLRSYIESQDHFEKKDIYSRVKTVAAEVRAAVDPIHLRKHSIEFSLGVSLRHEFARYFTGLKKNSKNQRKYDRKKARWDAQVARGKNPTWQVVPPYIIDLDLCKRNALQIIDSLLERYEKDFRHDRTVFDPKREMRETVDFFKEQASTLTYHVTKGIAKARAIKLLEEVGIPEPRMRYRQYPFEFSGGMRQRVVIAIALSANPEILICDEPTTALDVTIQAQILELINKIKQERNLSIIFITHNLGVVANMADRIAVMYAGKIVEYGTADDIFYDPRHPYTWALLSSMPDLDTKEKLEAIPGTPPNMIYPPVGDAFADRNKYAMQIDYEQQPPFFKVSDTHYAATWLLHPNAPKIPTPKTITDRIARMREKEKEEGQKPVYFEPPEKPSEPKEEEKATLEQSPAKKTALSKKPSAKKNMKNKGGKDQ